MPIASRPQLSSPEALNPGPAERFTGEVRIASIVEREGGPPINVYEVFFAAGARTVWHAHQGEQILVGLTGTCVVHIAGHAAQALRPGQAVRIAPGVRHWHGAATKSEASHLGLTEALPTAWREQVSDADYARATASLES